MRKNAELTPEAKPEKQTLLVGTSRQGVTQLIHRWRSGDRAAGDALLREIYPVFRAIAYKQLGSNHAGALRPTELANDAFMQLRDQTGLVIRDRDHFFAIAARAIRFSIVDYLRACSAEKRGAAIQVELLDNLTGDSVAAQNQFPWVDLERAMTALELAEPKQVELIELRYFMGLSIDDAAQTIGVSVPTAVRMWRFARAFLADYLGPQYA
jgi:RNA polymerase sigma factor (TIGR02999 family)